MGYTVRAVTDILETSRWKFGCKPCEHEIVFCNRYGPVRPAHPAASTIRCIRNSSAKVFNTFLVPTQCSNPLPRMEYRILTTSYRSSMTIIKTFKTGSNDYLQNGILITHAAIIIVRTTNVRTGRRKQCSVRSNLPLKAQGHLIPIMYSLIWTRPTYVSSHIGLGRSTSLFTTRQRLHSFYLSEGPRNRNHSKEVFLWCSRFTLFTVLLIILSNF